MSAFLPRAYVPDMMRQSGNAWRHVFFQCNTLGYLLSHITNQEKCSCCNDRCKLSNAYFIEL